MPIPISFGFDMPSIADVRNKFPTVLGMNTLDIGATAAVAYGYARYTDESFALTFAKLFIAGEVIHLAMGISTPFIERIQKSNEIKKQYEEAANRPASAEVAVGTY